MSQEKMLHCGTQILGSLETYTENTTWIDKLKGKVDTNVAHQWYFLHFEEDKLVVNELKHALEHHTGIAEVTGSNPVEALIFSGFFFPIA